MRDYVVVEWDESGVFPLLRFNSLEAESELEAIEMASGTYEAQDFTVRITELEEIPNTRESWERVLKKYYPDTEGVIIYVEGDDSIIFYPDGSIREINI